MRIRAIPEETWLHLEPAHWTMKEYNQPDQPVVGVNWETPRLLPLAASACRRRRMGEGRRGPDGQVPVGTSGIRRG